MSNSVPNGWRELEVRDAFDIGRGRVISKPEIKEQTGIYPVYSSQSTDKGKMGAINTYDFDGEYITWTTDGAYAGTVFHRNGKFNCTNVCGTLKDNEAYEVHPKYVASYLETVAKNHVSYVGNPKLMNGTFAEILFLLPPLAEQQKIASILTSVDDVIESTQAQINKLKDLKTGMMQELLTKGIGHTEFKDSPVGRIPKAWTVVRVGEVSKVIDSLHKTPVFCEHGWPMVRVTEIRQSNRLDMSKAAFVDENTFINFSKNYQPKIGDILVARVGAYFGSTTYIDKEMTFCLGQNTAAVRPTGVHPEYLFSFFNSQVGRKQIDESVAGSGQPSFSLKAIKELVLALPSLDEQRKISNVTDSIAQRIRTKERQFVLYLDVKKSLMQDLLTGKIRVQ
jgi:type I restriction enzyme S subunit